MRDLCDAVCYMLQCVAACGSVWQRAAACCSVLNCVAVRCSVLLLRFLALSRLIRR